MWFEVFAGVGSAVSQRLAYIDVGVLEAVGEADGVPVWKSWPVPILYVGAAAEWGQCAVPSEGEFAVLFFPDGAGLEGGAGSGGVTLGAKGWDTREADEVQLVVHVFG